MPQDFKKDEAPQPGGPQTTSEPAATSVQSAESQDTTGGRGSSQKHALKLNVEGQQGQRHPDTPAGQHATGSFIDEASKESV
ncbi:MAG TPA: hypothetical protein VGD64_11395 [Acidisarcina sp.]